MGSDQETNNDDSHPDNQRMVHDGWKDIREKPRSCTDCLFLLLLLASWIATTIIGFTVIGWIESSKLQSGNPRRLTNAIDYNGNICGYSESVKDKNYGYYMPDFTAVCVKNCPSVNDYYNFICKYDIPNNGSLSTKEGYEYVAQFKCNYRVKSIKFINRCFPDTNTLQAALDAQEVAADYGVDIDTSFLTYDTSKNKHTSWFNKFLGDVVTLRVYIAVFGIVVSTVLSFLYLYFLRIPGLLMLLLWSTVLSIFVLLFVGSFLLWSLGNKWSEDDVHSDSEVTAIYTVSYIGMAITVLYFCLVVVLRKRLNLAVSIVQLAAKALASVPTLLTLPILQVIGTLLFLVPWMIYIVYLASSGDIKTESATYTYDGITHTYSYRTLSYTQNTGFVFLYLLFDWFWTSEFILAVGQLVVALTFTAWYFNRDRSTVGVATVKWAMQTTFIYHLGTAAFGSLIIAIIKTIRAVILYLQRKAKKSQNKLALCVLKCLACITYCLEKIMRFINKHAYIMTAVYGYSFCKASRAGFFLILRNILRVAAVNLLSWFILFLGTLCIPLLSTFLCYLCIAYGLNNDRISGIIGPLVFTFLLAYWCTTMFMEIFGTGIETILVCFIADEEMFPAGERFADGELVEVIDKTAQATQQMKMEKEAAKYKEQKIAAAPTVELRPTDNKTSDVAIKNSSQQNL